MKQILCLSTSNYYPFPTRKQNVMNRLSDAEILYIEPPVTLLAPLKDKGTRRRLKAYRNPGERVKDNITVYAQPPVLPFFNKFRFINRINQRRLAGYLSKILDRHGFKKPYLWCYSPTSCDITKLIENRGVIYDCVDRHSAYPGMINPKVVDEMEKDLATCSHMVFCTAMGLYETLIEYNENTKLIPNGAAYHLFSKAGEGEKKRKDGGPIFGFIGMLQDCIDYNLLASVADHFPQGEVWLLGKPLPGVDLKAIEGRSNIRLLGLKPQEELPEYIREFDVCLNVFREGRLSKDVSPLKFYEYLATGKPIVSTREPVQVKDFADVVYIGENEKDFITKCEEALREDDPNKRKKRMEYGKACSWDERVREMERALKEKRIF
ncbi:MAG: hypothetical protein ACOX4U_01265 [Anaerovoracaceae bacterium]|jgi:glycosyltransferase involved in cell wall biosynthesis